jgi:hypothetical protein
MLQTKVVEKIKTHILRYVTFFSAIALFVRKCGKNFVQPGRPQMTIWRTRIACWIPKATNTHSEYVTLIAFPLQQRLHERALVLRYTCIDCLCYFSLLLHLVYEVKREWKRLHDEELYDAHSSPNINRSIKTRRM